MTESTETDMEINTPPESEVASTEESRPAITELPRRHRRVLGVLVEKAFTTPESYPLTLKAVTTACNQKSNRDPVVQYDEDDVLETLDQLREAGLVAEVHTESGRTERYRHYMRKRFTFSEPQLAIMTELLLRGRQTLGELRARASRMLAIDSLDDLRAELRGLQEMNLVQAGGSLERRGVEVDHNLYPPNERQSFPSMPSESNETAETPRRSPPISHSGVDQTVSELQQENRELRRDLDAVRDDLRRLEDQVDELRRALGG